MRSESEREREREGGRKQTPQTNKKYITLNKNYLIEN